MNTKTKKIISSLLIAANMAIPANITLAKEESMTHTEVKVYFNDEKIEFDQEPIIVDGRTKVPFRAIFESMGTIVYYRDSDSTVLGITRDGDTIYHKVGTNKATINGVEKTYDSVSEMRNYRTLVPVRMVADLLNAEVEWVQETNTVDIEKVITTNDFHKKIREVLACAADINFNPKDFKRYMAYQYKHWNMDPKQVILDVNMDLDLELTLKTLTPETYRASYDLLTGKDEDITVIEDVDSYTALVNKFNVLPESYVPANLYDFSVINSDPELVLYGYMSNECLMRKEIFNDFFEMEKAFAKYRNRMFGFNGPIGYLDQKNIKYHLFSMWDKLNYKGSMLSDEEKLKFASGYTYDDLQTGLSFHVCSDETNALQIELYRGYLGHNLTENEQYWYDLYNNNHNEVYNWMLENSYKYGFVPRYPVGKESVTRMLPNRGYYRYVGKDVAKIMHDENLCLEEYCAKYENKSGYKTNEESVKKFLLKY